MTYKQLLKKSKEIRLNRKTNFALNKCPQKRAICAKLYTMTPRKPNSALRKVARVIILSNKMHIIAFVPGEGGHSLQRFSSVLVRGGRVRDLPGVKYRLIRGARKTDLKGILKRRHGRSRYGTKRIR